MHAKRSSRHEIERYARLFAERSERVKTSAMRDMMSITDRPEVISLASGMPDTASFPKDLLESVFVDMARNHSAELLQYTPTDGIAPVKQRITEVMAAEGIRADIDNVLVTTGGQQAIDLITRVLVDPGDTIITEAPTYPGAVPSFLSFEAEAVQIDLDEHGMRIDLLEQELDRLDAAGITPKFIYTVPTFQNPAGVTMSLERRKRLVELASERELLVIEDNPYGMLRFSGEPVQTLRELDGGNFVIYLGTFSKILAPGLRMGWIEAPSPVIEKCNIAKAAADLNSSGPAQFLIESYFEQADWHDWVRTATGIYKSRRDAMLAALERYFPPEATWTHPEGGLFIWATLPDPIDTTDLLTRALRSNVAFVPGAGAYLGSTPDPRGRNTMRLNFSGVPEEKITEGIRRIGEVVEEQLDLWRTMTGEHRSVGSAAKEETDDPSDSNVSWLAGRKMKRRAG
jgi:2-aminoadipate transaminase